MSADTLREAARLMRERAGAATPGPWTYVEHENNAGIRSDAPGAGGPWPIVDRDLMPRDGDHIASWHPAVALAVADLLDAKAAMHECAVGLGARGLAGLGARGLADDDPALAVARAYLGEST